MPWVEAILRGQKVLARARDDGSFTVDGGRVEIRYKPNDGKAYRASAGNLERVQGGKVYPDEHAGPAEAPPETGPAAAKKKSGASAPAVTMKDAWIAYTDGACSGNPGPAGSGVIIVEPGGKIHEGFDYLGEATNNVAELTGILVALAAIPGDAKGVVIHTDSQYAIGVLTKGWKAKVNQELIRTIRAAIAARAMVRLVYVPGHAGVPMNERADELAREAIRVRRTRAISVA